MESIVENGGGDMTFRVNPLKGIYKKENYCHQLGEAEALHGYRRTIVLLLLLSACIYAVSAAFGMGTELLSKEMTSISGGELEAKKQLFLLGRVVLGLLVAIFFLFGSALYFWSFLNLPYQQLVIIQLSVFSVFLLEKLIQIPLFLMMDINAISNPLSLGIVAQYVTDKELIIQFFSKITIFQIWMMTLLCYYLQRLSEQRNKVIVILVVGFFLFYWIFSSLLSFVKNGIFL